MTKKSGKIDEEISSWSWDEKLREERGGKGLKKSARNGEEKWRLSEERKERREVMKEKG